MNNMNWNEIIGHKNKISNIRDMIKSQQFPNAVIFFGAEGIGKRKIAETAAAALLCENDDAPCGHCKSCQLFLANTHPDYHYIEPDRSKANPMIKIEQIRNMQRDVSLMPVVSKRRIVIIDDADCMNKISQNCLLKTIEEPQGLSKFILITSNRSGLLLTIRSRCMMINFEPLTKADIALGLSLRNIEEAEKIAAISNGSLGQAIKLTENNGFQIREDTLKFLESLQNMNIENMFAVSQTLSSQPKELFIEWTIHLQKFLRDLLVINENISDEYFYNGDIKARLQKLKGKFIDSKIYAILHETAEIQRRLRSNANLQLLIDSFFIRLKQNMQN